MVQLPRSDTLEHLSRNYKKSENYFFFCYIIVCELSLVYIVAGKYWENINKEIANS